ncbi:peptidoglycan endo-beta-N-acetylglucosaminidase [Staphylococcus aureus]|uniref:Peptidoglycan endo-beta-N-acetylglucosaminidase n=1 Tax=Staphylococcus aureus TaxID=1280 RepID=A0A380E5G1_STAAU|nr:peptidoglycan endo-beta-N-acetylglucosaminidase [Staphylococcus aureus]
MLQILSGPESNATIIADFYKNMKTEGKYFKYFVYKMTVNI